MRRRVLTEDEAIELFAFLMTSARSQLDDPCRYASMRLLSAAEELRVRGRRAGLTRSRDARSTVGTAFAQTHTNDLEVYTATLDELCATDRPLPRRALRGGDGWLTRCSSCSEPAG